MRVIVLLGAPGAGKGTQAEFLTERLGLVHLATGDLFRAAVAAGTALGLAAKEYMERGELVPDDVVIGVFKARFAEPDAERGVLLDGFPRTRAQARALDTALAGEGSAVERAVYIEVPAEDLLVRLGGRWICRAHGHPYHELYAPPRVPGICDEDGSELIQRVDDRPETVRARLDVQLPALAEVVEYYRQAGVLATIDGTKPIDVVSGELIAALEPRRGKAA